MIRSYGKIFAAEVYRIKFQILPKRFQWNPAEEIADFVPRAYRSPFALVEADLQNIPISIGQELTIGEKKLEHASQYHFDQLGKLFRPTLVLLMSHLVNTRLNITNPKLQEQLFTRQFRVAMIAEMIHTASLIHDDILDASPTRRNEPTVHVTFGTKTAVLTGDFILSRASRLISRLNSCAATEILSRILEDLVVGEMMQANGPDNVDKNYEAFSDTSFDFSNMDPWCRQHFNHYLDRIYHKTASLMANSCKAVGAVSDCDSDLMMGMFDIGRKIGMAFQIMDDLLDITSQLEPETLGKPTGADLKLGLATAPVLFASEEHPALLKLIKRRFTEEGDVQTAISMIHKSSALEKTGKLAQHHANEAVHLMNKFFKDSSYRTALSTLALYVTHRNK